MKPLILATATAIAVGSCADGVSQTSFSNLNFEQAKIVQGSPFGPDFSNAFPNWVGFAVGVPVTSVEYDEVVFDTPPRIGIWDTTASPASAFPQPATGRYAAFLKANFAAAGAWLEQTSLVPSFASSLRFSTTPFSLLTNPQLKPEYWRFSVLLNGQSLPYYVVDSSSDWVTWAADVSGYAGQTAELRFMLESGLPGTPPGDAQVAIGLDNIFFSPVAIPEPASIALLSVGAALAGAIQFVRRRRVGRKGARLCIGLLIGASLPAAGQGFVNFDFESAVVRPEYAIFQPWSSAAPGWSHSAGSDTDVIYYRDRHLGSSQMFLLLDSTGPWTSLGPLSGSYSLLVESGSI